MSKFATENISAIKAREIVEQLIIDNVRVLDSYEKSLQGTTYKSEYNTIIRYIQYAADGNSLPDTKMRKYKGNNDGVTEFEFKSKHLRVWAIQIPNRKLVIYGGFKNNQARDEKAFWELKKQYLEFIKQYLWKGKNY